MSAPPKGTIHIKLLPPGDAGILLGIDLHFFNVNSTLKGIKLIPEGLHFFHYSGDEAGVRSGWWLEVHEGTVLTIEWNKEQERFEKSPQTDLLGDDYAYMVKYQQALDWTVLTKDIDREAIEEFVPDFPEHISTATPSKEENMVLLDALLEKNPNQTFQDQHNKELNYTILQPKQQGPNPLNLVEAVTSNALDKSWYAKSLYKNDIELLLAELELCFVHLILVGNVCSLTQYMLLLNLVLLSGTLLRQDEGFTRTFLEVFIKQLETVPEEYIRPTGLEVVNTKDLVAILENLAQIFAGTAVWNKIKGICQERIELDVGALETHFDDDNYEIYDIENHDTDDEDAPAVV